MAKKAREEEQKVEETPEEELQGYLDETPEGTPPDAQTLSFTQEELDKLMDAKFDEKYRGILKTLNKKDTEINFPLGGCSWLFFLLVSPYGPALIVPKTCPWMSSFTCRVVHSRTI